LALENCIAAGCSFIQKPIPAQERGFEELRMDCGRFLEELSNYIDGDVAEGLRQALQEHAAFCRKCEVLYDSTRHTLEIVTEHGQYVYELPPVVGKRLHLRLHEAFDARRGA
jgi:hypothetical protein